MSNDTFLDNFNFEIINLLKEIAEEHGFEDFKINTASASSKGDGYLGVITAVEISSNDEKINLIVKSAVENDALRRISPMHELYQRENYMYRTIIPAFSIFQAEHHLAPISSFAKYYNTIMTEKKETIILENLRAKGFSIRSGRIPMDKAHVTIALKEYGRFHALSFAIRDQNSEHFKTLINPMDNIVVKFTKTMDVQKWTDSTCRGGHKALSTIEDEEAREVFTRFSHTIGEFLLNAEELVDEYSSIIHGDGWANNILFAYDDPKKPESPTRVSLIDLQLSRIGPPVLDISYFFYTCSSKDIITNFQHYLDIYYSSLSDYLRKLGSDPEKLYPYSVFRRQWKESARFGLFMSLFIIKLMLSEQDEVADLADVADSGKSVADAFDYDIAKSDEYNDRVKHIILHFVNNKFI